MRIQLILENALDMIPANATVSGCFDVTGNIDGLIVHYPDGRQDGITLPVGARKWIGPLFRGDDWYLYPYVDDEYNVRTILITGFRDPVWVRAEFLRLRMARAGVSLAA